MFSVITKETNSGFDRAPYHKQGCRVGFNLLKSWPKKPSKALSVIKQLPFAFGSLKLDGDAKHSRRDKNTNVCV